MELLLAIGLLAIGLLAVFIELFLIPGGLIVGVLGFGLMAGSVYLAYDKLGAATGNLFLLIALVAFVTMLIFGLRRIASLRWADKEAIDSRVGELEHPSIKPGDEGVAFNTLRPNGTAIIDELRVEVFSTGEFIEPQTQVVVTKVTSNRIYVKPIIKN